MQFCCSDRPQILQTLESERFDLLIIGGGITGVGIALDAVSRGLKTALIEKEDFAYGTSSRSTKLIHGGLRYLKQMEFALVREVGFERAVVHHLAPHLVVPQKMLLPLTETSMSTTVTSIALRAYDWLAGVRGKDRRKMLKRSQVLQAEPLLKESGIKGGALYAEYRTDDARLTLEIGKTAVDQGAVLLNHCEATEFIYSASLITGLRATERLTGKKIDIQAKVVVNAAGPWVDIVRHRDRSPDRLLHLTKGVHIVLAHERLPLAQSVYFGASDGRMIFAIPRGRCTYVGTTDTNYAGSPDDVSTTLADATYLVAAVNDSFPSAEITLQDVESSWAGLRPLIHEPGKSATEISRKDEVFVSPSGLISIAGGKLTGYRKMAERAVNLVIAQHFVGRKLKSCRTRKLKLSSSVFPHSNDVNAFIDRIKSQLRALGLPEHYAPYLVQNYANDSIQILAMIEGGQESDYELALILAELQYSFKHEMICTLNDFLIRRTGRLYFHIWSILNYDEEIIREMAHLCKWSKERTDLERAELKKVLSRARLIEE